MAHEAHQYQQIIGELAASIARKRDNKKTRLLTEQGYSNGMSKKRSGSNSRDSAKNPNAYKKQQRQAKTTLEQDVQTLDVSDMLKTLSHQKKALTFKRRQQLFEIHTSSKLSQDDYKHFMMVASQANYRKLQHPGYYRQLLSEVDKYPDLFFSCIDKDIPRTMPDDHPLQISLRNVLYAYAIRNPSLLYCQGMNYIVGFLLINKFGEEEAFWLMVQLIEDMVMPDYFKDLSTISITVQVFEDVMAVVFPELANEMNEVGMESGIFLVSWFICLFTKGFINSVSQHLLQEVVLQSYYYPVGFTLTRISLSILASLFTREQRFQFEQKDFKSLKESIESSVYEMSLEELKKGLNYFEFDFDSYVKLTEIYTNRKEKTFKKALQKQLQQKKLSLPACNISNPVCIHRVEIQKKIGTVEQVLILKNDIPIEEQLILDYFPFKTNKQQPKIWYEEPRECPITHHTHICKYPPTKLTQSNQLAQQNSKYYPVFEGECSIQVESRFTKVEDRFSELSKFFDVNQKLSSEEEDIMELSMEEDIVIQADENEDSTRKQNRLNFVSSVGNVFRKAFEGIKLLRIGTNQGV